MNAALAQPAPAPTALATPRPERAVAIDLLRGVVMVLMVLDHARDFFVGLRVRPTDLAATTVPLFFTRWVTHFCAPVFVFLAGTAAYLYGTRHGRAQVSRFLLGRGLLLIVLELTIVRLCWIPDLGYHFTLLQVIWALGWSMIALAGLSRLPWKVLLAVGAVIVGGHDLLDGIDARALGGLAPLWKLLHQPGWIEPVAGHRLMVTYTLVPWIGVMALGYGFGRLFERPIAERRPVILKLGVGMVIAFLVLRATPRAMTT